MSTDNTDPDNRAAQGVPIEYGNRALQGGFRKGFAARLAGEAKDANPYGDQRTWFGGVTFARAFWKAWNRGWELASTPSPDAPVEP